MGTAHCDSPVFTFVKNVVPVDGSFEVILFLNDSRLKVRWNVRFFFFHSCMSVDGSFEVIQRS